MKYFFDANGLCKGGAIIIQNPQNDDPPLGTFAWGSNPFAAKIDGSAGYDPYNVVNESGALRNRNALTLVGDSTTNTGAVKFHVSSVSYYPARVLVNSVAYVLNSTSPLEVGGFAAGAAVTVAPNSNYSTGNTLTLYAYDPCSCSCCNG
ncbi:hypothetical protein [Anaeroselena agilis]|uniref:Uncharacterized protein n=1 Tax=Anaeroselena agilis TaxID=3063788 RepID=A0ABU3NUD0_9FIRM|nr:hypothetical protein [Selenomonadales bacterium 4137-cl]